MIVWQRPDLLEQLLPNVDLDEARRIRVEADKLLEIQKFKTMADALEPLPTADELASPLAVDLSSNHVTIGKRSDLTEDQFSLLESAVAALHPWRKGPFRLFDLEVDAEWRSNLKWDRVAEAIGDISGKQIVDIGCGNGYYMFRAAAQNPRAVIGMDPSIPFYYAFELFQRYLRLPNLQYERMGFDHLHVFEKTFDVALLMGILYHHRSPIDILRSMIPVLRIGGTAIIECQTIPGEGSMALFPEERYAKARNVYFMPTKDCLINWVRRSGFRDIELVSHTKVTIEEQRRTPQMTFESLADFLDPQDHDKTIEGYPAPYRTVVKATRKF
jgi:tRNA (mo5U34)-methyltransferase